MLPEGLGPSTRSTSAANGIEDIRCDSPPRWPHMRMPSRAPYRKCRHSSQDILLSVCVGNAPTLADDGAHSLSTGTISRARAAQTSQGWSSNGILRHDVTLTYYTARAAHLRRLAARLLETRVVPCPTCHSPSATRFYQQLAAAASPTHRPSPTT
ncbi:hypothetical protein K438DRAFT_2026187 [Mycena galopus ATCC 62051]|nr:hypothetical protein K438DRAFT_2026187 [Mycena galopus ATCC 62051]